MADIINPEAIAFVNQYIRPLAERLRDARAVIEDTKGQWIDGGLAGYFSGDDDPVKDDREDEGVSRLTGKDVTDFGVVAIAVLAVLDADMPVVRKPTVRPLAVSG